MLLDNATSIAIVNRHDCAHGRRASSNTRCFPDVIPAGTGQVLGAAGKHAEIQARREEKGVTSRKRMLQRSGAWGTADSLRQRVRTGEHVLVGLRAEGVRCLLRPAGGPRRPELLGGPHGCGGRVALGDHRRVRQLCRVQPALWRLELFRLGYEDLPAGARPRSGSRRACLLRGGAAGGAADLAVDHAGRAQRGDHAARLDGGEQQAGGGGELHGQGGGRVRVRDRAGRCGRPRGGDLECGHGVCDQGGDRQPVVAPAHARLGMAVEYYNAKITTTSSPRIRRRRRRSTPAPT